MHTDNPSAHWFFILFFVTEFLELQPKARVRGDVHYKAIEIHLGATLDGKLEHSGVVGGADAQRAGLKLAANNA